MTDSLDDRALCAIGLHTSIARAAHSDAPAGCRPMRVVEVQRTHVLLHDGHRLHRAPPQAGALAERPPQAGPASVVDEPDDRLLVVGDWVWAQPGAATVPGVIRWPRRTALVRRTHDGRGGILRQVLVANVDTALLVMGLDHDFNPRRLERYLALVHLAGLQAVLVLTKADLVDPAQAARREALAREVLPPAMPCLAVDARSPDTAQRLQPWLPPGQTGVLLGSSGAGKSTLTSTLVRPDGTVDGVGPDDRQRPQAGATRAGDDRGRHTTTVRTLHHTAGGACLIDTPGLRALRLDVDDADDLAQAFGDVALWAAQCRFRDCQHQAEPGCAVRAAVPEARLRNFHKLVREVRRDQLSALERQTQLAQWKARGRAGRQRLQTKRGG
ncbi:MAG: ribosome small subunit-dependent GTPase A [Burkholderiales bacterium PBB5]|nr:MAG: ribosome small subunit-dependent GTPase A [Burkholderiales bacterium PBB5]